MRRAPSRLERLRRRVDALDRRIAALLGRRLRLVDAIAPMKARPRDAGRERAVLKNVLSAAGGGRDFLAEIYRAVLRASRRRQAGRRGRRKRG
ncbi:MAG: chorismate mutase [Elusimicrobia bacterium]|nr:chorismate mutase [Elusimicrobiota bacterium]